MSDHAKLAPSAAAQWGNCAGSVKAQAARPSYDSEQSREGTAAHWVVSEVLNAYKSGAPAHCITYEGRTAPNGVIIDDKAVEGAQVMVDSVVATFERWGRQGDLCIEERVHMPAVHPDVWGTLDAALYAPASNALYIWDYKHGHRDCKAEGNLQLICYLAGLVEKYRIDDVVTTVVARIVQPFCYSANGSIKEWVVPLSDLRAYWNKLNAKAHEALSDSPKLSTGVWCRDCRAVGVCAAARMAGYNFVDVVEEPYQMDTMTGADLATERSILADGLAAAKARLDAIEDELTHRLQRGETDSGLALEVSRGREQWSVPDAQVIALCGNFGVDARKEVAKTPKQTRDAAPKGVRPALEQALAKIVRRSAGQLKLVPAETTKTARAFKPRK